MLGNDLNRLFPWAAALIIAAAAVVLLGILPKSALQLAASALP